MFSQVFVHGGGGGLSLCPRVSLSRGVSVQGVSVHECLCLGVSLTRGVSAEVSVQGGLCPGGSLSRGVSVQGVSLSGGVSVQGVSVQGVCPGGLSREVCLEGLCPGGSLSGRPPGQRPPHTVTSRWYVSYWNVFLL